MNICCKNCSNETNIHAQGYCHLCYKRLRRSNIIDKIHASQTLPLTAEQKGIIVGSLLGDGCMRKPGKTKRSNANLYIGRAAKDIDYLSWQAKILNNLLISGIKFSSLFDKRTNKYYDRASFYTKSCTILTSFYDKWYINNRKIIPNDLNLTNYSIATWFCDDGSVYCGKNKYILNITFATNSFTKDEVYFLRDLLCKRYNETFYVSKTHNNGNEQYLLGSSNDGSRAVLNEIDPIINGFMKRKSLVWRSSEARFYKNIPRHHIEKELINLIRFGDCLSMSNISNYLNVNYKNKPMYNVFMPYLNEFIDNGFVEKNYINGKSFNIKITELGKLKLR